MDYRVYVSYNEQPKKVNSNNFDQPGSLKIMHFLTCLQCMNSIENCQPSIIQALFPLKVEIHVTVSLVPLKWITMFPFSQTPSEDPLCLGTTSVQNVDSHLLTDKYCRGRGELPHWSTCSHSIIQNNGTQIEQSALMMLYTLQIIPRTEKKMPLLFHYMYVVTLNKTLHDSRSAYFQPVL